MDEIDPIALRAELAYDPWTGHFYAEKNRVKPLGWTDKHGYIKISFRGKKYLAHRLAWLYVTNTPPAGVIDHINRNRSDNRIRNLRDVSQAENNFNRGNPEYEFLRHKDVGISKITLKSGKERFQVIVNAGGWVYYVGRFDTLEEAQSARNTAILKHGRKLPE